MLVSPHHATYTPGCRKEKSHFLCLLPSLFQKMWLEKLEKMVEIYKCYHPTNKSCGAKRRVTKRLRNPFFQEEALHSNLPLPLSPTLEHLVPLGWWGEERLFCRIYGRP